MRLTGRVHRVEAALRPSWKAVRWRLAERTAKKYDLDPREVLAEADRILAWAEDRGIRRLDEFVAVMATENGLDPAVLLAEIREATARWAEEDAAQRA